jgi:PTS system mannose-specific IIA component
MIGLVVITHGVFGREMLRTAQDIVGNQTHMMGLALTSDMGSEGLIGLVEEAAKRLNDVDGILYLVDMLGGTPCNVVLLHTRNHAAEVITGVNLYMILSAFKHRNTMDLKTLARRVAEDGSKSITLAKELLAKKNG